MELRTRIEKNIRQFGLLTPGAPVLLAVSGGVDSMVLLRILTELAAENQWALSVAHFNHCLRALESDTDEAFVRTAAAKLKLPFYTAAGEVRAHAAENGLSIEMAARELRHRFLLETARRLNIARIALAHHADDQIETFWLRLLRGDVGSGLGGMRWTRRAAAEPPIDLVRPLLNISKADLILYASEHSVAFREDRSNEDVSILRNRLRLEVLPALEAFQPAFRSISLRAAEITSAEKSFLESEARRWLEQRGRTFAELPLALQREIVRVQLFAAGITPTFELVEELRTRPNMAVSVTSNRQAILQTTGEIRLRETPRSGFDLSNATADFTAAGNLSFGGVDFEWTVVPAREPSQPGVEYFDADSLGSQIRLRHWRPGDRFQPIGLTHDAKLQDLFTNQKIDAVEKRQRIVAVAADGKIFWVEGLRISERHKVRPETRRVLRWNWRRL